MMTRWTHLFIVAAIAAVVPALAQGPQPAAQGAAPPSAGPPSAVQAPQGAPPAGRPGGPGGGRGPFVPSGPGRSNNPFPAPIPADEAVITVKLAEFASLPDVVAPAGPQAARMNLLVDEPGTKRLFVNVMTGTLYAVSYDGKSVAPYLEINDPKWAT